MRWETGKLDSCGLSGAWLPSGEVLARTGTEAGVVFVDLDPAELRRYRT